MHIDLNKILVTSIENGAHLIELIPFCLSEIGQPCITRLPLNSEQTSVNPYLPNVECRPGLECIEDLCTIQRGKLVQVIF